MKLAFLGLGSMGAPMALLLLDAGFDLTVYNRTPERAQTLEAAGAQRAESPREAASTADIAFTMLADDDAVLSVLDGETGLCAGLRPDALHVSMSTISVALSQTLAKRHAAAGQRYLAAPVFGRPDAAEAKKLWVLTGGAAADVATARPALEAMSQGLIEIGEQPESANAVKLAGNYTIAAMMETLGEAFALVRKSGLSAERFLEIINGHVFKSPVYENYGGLIAAQRFEPAGFKLELGLKDLRLVLAAAADAQAPMPLASLMHDRYLGAVARGMGDLDWSALGRVAADDAGLA